LLHCQQGISRSATLVIAYIMWKRKVTFRQALDFVTKKRPVVSPNGGFMGQLLLWESFLRSVWSCSHGIRMTRISMLESSRHEVLFVGKDVGVPSRASLDARGCFVIHDPSKNVAYAWLGKRSTEEYRNGAMKFVDQLERFLNVQTTPQELQGFESANFWCTLGETAANITFVSKFDREYGRLEPNVLYRAPAWDRIEARSKQLFEEAQCQIWAYFRVLCYSPLSDDDSSVSSSLECSSPTAVDSAGSTKSIAKAEAFFWIPKNFVFRLANGIETRVEDEVFTLISAAFIGAGAFPDDTICRRVATPAEILDLKFNSSSSTTSTLRMPTTFKK